MKKKDIIADLQKKLKRDKSYWHTWQCNIAMCYIDAHKEFKEKTKKRTMTHEDRMRVSMKGADLFLKLLCS